MTRSFKFIAATALLAAAATSTVAYAQDLAGAIASGAVGEQADGYMGVRGAAGGGVRAAVEALNIKRRAAYTELAAKRAVTVQEVAASVGCQTLRNRVAPGQAYQLRDGQWRVRDAAPIALPDYCG